MDIRRYTRLDVLRAAAQRREALARGELNRLEFTISLLDFLLRDLDGRSWFLDARSDSWFVWADDHWQPVATEAVAERVEALDRLPAFSDQAADEIEARVGALFSEEPPAGGAAMALTELLARIRRAFEEGLISSDEACEIAATQYLIDETGGIWTVGLQSGGWFRFEETSWHPATAPPAPESLLRLRPEAEHCAQCGADLESRHLCRSCGHWMPPELEGTSEVADRALLGFLMVGLGTLPEPLVEPWDPPGGLPDDERPGLVCGGCGASNPAESRFCNQCAAPFGCPACGAVLSTESRFCSQCGAKVAPA
ncbi:MAG: zinc ribbon domain-containing protein [Deltaproteobacteria bacterium]|nr:zinc ribbon domain-containing protein [Deltaproteobacteria bacterium]MBW2396301.1 zinc ribbon domain-containing protein [Deltaproteobacteria bacterium]